MPNPRSRQICLQATPYYHCVSRCVRRAFLCGKDKFSNKSFEHRREWVERRLLFLSEIFCIDICAYAVMTNHCHLVLHVDKNKAEALSDTEVIHRWHRVCKGTLITQQFIEAGHISESLVATLNATITTYRNRLFDISWFMRLLNEPIARMANAEDNCTGRFWEGRFMSQALLDEPALAACMTYVDLNPLRAGIAQTPETSMYTSIRRRVSSALKGRQPEKLMKFVGDAKENMPSGLPFKFEDYLNLLDLTSRVIKDKNCGYIDSNAPNILARLNISSQSWLSLTTRFEFHFRGPAGHKVSLTHLCEIQNRERRINMGSSKKFFI
ncbi:transposase [Thalassotalea litorea]|uniref:transposase n=1 Tax=Thalassotalea litorea TaxID=2020715 RepID=UPI003734F6ED